MEKTSKTIDLLSMNLQVCLSPGYCSLTLSKVFLTYRIIDSTRVWQNSTAPIKFLYRFWSRLNVYKVDQNYSNLVSISTINLTSEIVELYIYTQKGLFSIAFAFSKLRERCWYRTVNRNKRSSHRRFKSWKLTAA
jgi:hypothetical protein